MSIIIKKHRFQIGDIVKIIDSYGDTVGKCGDLVRIEGIENRTEGALIRGTLITGYSIGNQCNRYSQRYVLETAAQWDN